MIGTLMTLAALGQGPAAPMLVSPVWLAEHLDDRNLVLFQLGPRASYDSAHIAGAQYLSLNDVSAPRSTTPPLELPEPAALDSVLEARGVSDDSRIVLYWSDEWVTPTTRVYLTLTWAGLGDHVSVLDGGLKAWRAAEHPVTADVPTVSHGSVTLHPRDDVVVKATWVADHLQDPAVTIVDARDPLFYEGRDTNYSRSGHIPGAHSIPFRAVVATDLTALPTDSLRSIFGAAGATPAGTVVTYCHIGQQASLVWFAARLAGYPARLYDGSFTEWNDLTQYSVEKAK